MSPASAPGRRMARHERRLHLLEAAARVVVEHGLHGVTMERVAEKAAVSRALVYTYFDSSDHVLLELHDRESGALEEAVVEAMTAAGPDLMDRIAAATEASVDRFFERGSVLVALFAGPEGRLAERRRAREAQTLSFWASEFTARLGLDGAVAVDAAAIILGAFTGVLGRLGAGAPRERVVQEYMALLDGGLAAVARKVPVVHGGG